MKQTTRLLLLLTSIFSAAILYSCSGTSPEYTGYSDQLKDQIQAMKTVLNAGHYKEFMSNYVSPAYISSQGGVDAALLKFDNSKQQALYKALTVARNVTPLYNSSGKTMTYSTTTLPMPIVFKMEGSKWYLTSDWFQ